MHFHVNTMSFNAHAKVSTGTIQLSSHASPAERTMRQRAQQVTAYLAKHPVSNLLMTLTRNKNQNFVCYQAMLQKGGQCFMSSKPVDVFWLDIEPSYQEAARRAGRTHDRCELSWLERRHAFGVTTIRRGGSDTSPTEFVVGVVALPRRTFTMRIVNSVPRLIGTIAKQRAVLQRVHVNETSQLLGPKVESVFLIGNCLLSGRLLVEEVKKSA